MSDRGKSHNDNQKDRSSPTRGRSTEQGQRNPRDQYIDRSPHDFTRGRQGDQTSRTRSSSSDTGRSQSTAQQSLFSDNMSRSSSLDSSIPEARFRENNIRNPNQSIPPSSREFGWINTKLFKMRIQDSSNSNQAHPLEQRPESSRANGRDHSPTLSQLRANLDRLTSNTHAGDGTGNSNQAHPPEQGPESSSANTTDQHPTLEQLRQIRMNRFSPNDNSNKQPESKPDKDEQGH